MGLEIESQVFKWLQTIKLVREAKRASPGKVELTENATARFFDGLYISQIVKRILQQRGQPQASAKLSAIKQNSTPAIRLYNWNLLADALKKLGYTIDYSEKSKLLNLQSESILKIIKHLWGMRGDENLGSGGLGLSIGDVSKKNLREASNVLELLVISICNNFKLSVQHALNLFLDNNKYLAHLLVKGVKGSYEPVLSLINDCKQQLQYIVDSLLCVDEKESFDLFLGALKPCLISKQPAVSENCLTLLQQLCESYITKGLNFSLACDWMERQGFDTIFFSIKRHPTLFSKSLSVAYAFMDQKLFQKLQPEDKSLLWNNEAERLSFYRQLLDEAHPSLQQKFIEDPVFEQWNKVCVKALRKAYSPKQKMQLIYLFEQLWNSYPEAFEKSQLSLPSTYATFIKSCTLANEQIVFVEATRVLFTLIVKLGLAKNQNAPILYKTAITSLTLQENPEHIEFTLQNFIQIMRDIPSLPAAPLAQPLLKLAERISSATTLGLVKLILAEGRIREVEKEELEEALLKISFNDITLSSLAQEILINHLTQPGNDQNLRDYCTAGLAQFYSISRTLQRTLKELRIDEKRYRQQEVQKRGQPTFLYSIQKYLQLSNIVSFLQKAIFVSLNCKEDIQSHIFHTYIRIERQLKREYLSRLLMPLMRSYYDQYVLPRKLQQYLEELQPPVLNFESIGQSEHQSLSVSPESSSKVRRKNENLKTQQSRQAKGLRSIVQDLEQIKKKRQQQKQREMLRQKQRQVAQEKKELYFSMINQKRKVECGKSRQTDLDYKYLLDFDSVKQNQRPYGIFDLNLINLHNDEEEPYIEDASAVIRKYRKLWRFLFFKYSSFGLKGQAEGQHPQQKINGADILKFLKEYEVDLLNKEKVLALVKKVNESQKRKNDPSNLTYLGFQQYILQFCYIGYRREFPSNPPGRQIIKFIEHLRSVTAAKGGSVQMFDTPEQMYFQQTDVIREFNKRLSENPDYPLPEGYKKIRQTQLKFHYSLTQFQKGVKPSRQAAVQVLDDILFSSFGFRVLQPLTMKQQRCLARPVLFQKIKQKLKDYNGGYLMPKRSAYLPKIDKETSPAKPQFHLLVPFSLGIKLGIAGTDIRNRILAEEVAYWLDDALDAVEAGHLKVGNKSKTRVQNQLIRRKRSEAIQSKMEKLQQEKRQRARAQTLKHQTQKYHEDQKQKEKKNRQELKLQRQKRKQKEELLFQKKKAEFDEAKNKLEAKRKEIQSKRQVELQLKKKQKEDYKKNVDIYFKKKKEELQEQQKSMKMTKQQDQRLKRDKAERQAKKRRRLEIQVFKKEEQVLQKLTDSKQSYEEVWKSQDIQEEIQRYRPGLKLMFDLLLKYEKAKISTTGQSEISLNTLNFFLLKTKMVPLFIAKTAIALIFRAATKKAARNGIDYNSFQQLLFKIAVRGKNLLNSHKVEEGEDFEMVDNELPSLKSSPEFQSPSKKSLTDEYALDASGVTVATVRRLMEYLRLPEDKPQAEQRFRELLESKDNKPVNLMLREARSLLDSTVI